MRHMHLVVFGLALAGLAIPSVALADPFRPRINAPRANAPAPKFNNAPAPKFTPGPATGFPRPPVSPPRLGQPPMTSPPRVSLPPAPLPSRVQLPGRPLGPTALTPGKVNVPPTGSRLELARPRTGLTSGLVKDRMPNLGKPVPVPLSKVPGGRSGTEVSKKNERPAGAGNGRVTSRPGAGNKGATAIGGRKGGSPIAGGKGNGGGGTMVGKGGGKPSKPGAGTGTTLGGKPSGASSGFVASKPGSKFKPIKPSQHLADKLITLAHRVIDAKVQIALHNLAAGTPLSGQQADCLNSLMSDPGLSGTDQQALGTVLQQCQAAEPERVAADPDRVVGEPERIVTDAGHGGETVIQSQPPVVEEQQAFTQRYLQVRNNTGERLTVYLQYCTFTDANTWHWFPANPAESEAAVVWTLEAGQSLDLQDGDWWVKAGAVHLWAVTASGATFDEYKDEVLWLVEEDEAGDRVYTARDMERHEVTFGSADRD